MSKRYSSGAALLLTGLLVLLLALIGSGVAKAQRLTQLVRRAQQNASVLLSEGMGSGADALPSAGMPSLRRDLEDMNRELLALQRSTGWLWRAMASQTHWAALANWGSLADQGLAAGTELTTALWWSALAAETTIEARHPASSDYMPPLQRTSQPLERAFQALRKERPRLLRARQAFMAMQETCDQLGPRLPMGALWQPYLAQAPQLVDALLILPNLLYSNEECNLLLLVQNSDELRATGGFISSVALLEFRAATLSSVSYLNSYEIESYHSAHPEPPAPLREHMGAAVLLLRDANWSADFPTSAEVIAALFRLDMGKTIDAVVAVDTHMVELVLGALGALPVPEYDVIVTADNYMPLAEGFWERPLGAAAITERHTQREDWLTHRKDFGGAVLQAGIERLKSVSFAQLLALSAAVQEGIRSKDLLVWARDGRTLQADLRRAGLDGSLQNPPGDYMMVVDSNLGWNKADRHIERSIDYRVDITPEGLHATLSLTYRHGADNHLERCTHRADYMDTYEELSKQCYWNYVRVLVPRGSVLQSVRGVDGRVDTLLEGGKTCFATPFVLPPGEECTLHFEYVLPDSVLRQEPSHNLYTLYVQKQPGTRQVALQVALHLAEGRTIDGAVQWELLTPHQLVAQRVLDRDLEFMARYAR
jgi:hypothetical protein